MAQVPMAMMEGVQEGITALVLPELKALGSDLAAVKTELARLLDMLDTVLTAALLRWQVDDSRREGVSSDGRQ